MAAAIELTQPTVILGDAKRLRLVSRVSPSLPQIEFSDEWLSQLLAAPQSGPGRGSAR